MSGNKLRAVRSAGARPGKSSLPEDEADRVREAMWKLFREKYGENKAEFGRAIGISGPAVGYILYGSNKPSIPTVQRVAELLGIDENELRKDASPRRGGLDAMSIALAYWPDRWAPEDVTRARELAAEGERQTAQGWTVRLDEIRAHRLSSPRKN